MSPLRNRVTPLGEIVAHPARGEVYANRGCLHDANGEIRRTWQVRRWIACRLEFKGRRRALLQPGRYTELFFLDEATAFAAGHRPCAECRREDYVRFQGLWRGGDTHAGSMDGVLHAERLDGHERRLHDALFGDLPDGAFVLRDDEPWMARGRELLRWTPTGYTERTARPTRGARATLLTPPSLVHVLASPNWTPAVTLLHSTAR